MRFSRTTLAATAAAAFVGGVAAQQPSGTVMTHVVQVGDAQNGKKFYPEKISAKPGDVVQFHFYPEMHSVAQSAFDKPCDPIENTNSSIKGFWSGPMPVTAESKVMPVFTIPINSTAPLWFYCATARHCQSGMVGVINEPEGRTLEEYKQNAASVARTGIPAGAGGGTNSTSGRPSAGSGTGNQTNPTSGSLPPPSPSSGTTQDSSTGTGSAVYISGATLSALLAVAMGFVVL